MIKIHCEALKNLVNNFICNWNCFYILLVPALFGFAFPFYWLVFLPLFWEEFREWEKPYYWIIGYWGFAALVWLIFVIVVFLRFPSSSAASGNSSNHKSKKNGRRNMSASTEDLWSEDKYYPDIQSPDYIVSLNAVQPDRIVTEPKMTMDETWDYNYDSKSDPSTSNSISFNCKPSVKTASAKTSLLGVGNNYTIEQKKAYQSLGYTVCPNNSSSSSSNGSCSSSSNNNIYLQHQRLNRKSVIEVSKEDEKIPRRRRCASTSPYGERNSKMKHLAAPDAPRSPSLPKRGSPHRGCPLNHSINPRHLRPVRDVSRPLSRSVERKKSPLVGNENRSPTPTVIRKQSVTRKPCMTPIVGLSTHPNNINNVSSDAGSVEKALGSEDKNTMFDSYLKIVPNTLECHTSTHSKINEEYHEEYPLILPSNPSSNSFEEETRSLPSTNSTTSSSTISDAKFELILASLHGIALDLEKEPLEETNHYIVNDIVSIPSLTGEDEMTFNENTFLSQSY